MVAVLGNTNKLVIIWLVLGLPVFHCLLLNPACHRLEVWGPPRSPETLGFFKKFQTVIDGFDAKLRIPYFDADRVIFGPLSKQALN